MKPYFIHLIMTLPIIILQATIPPFQWPTVVSQPSDS